MKHPTLSLVAFLAPTIVGLFACQKPAVEPDIKPTIEGHWVNLTKSHPDWRYLFHENILTQYIVDFGDTIVEQKYTYAVRNDTIHIGGNPNNYERTWKVTFWCDSIIEIQPISTNVIIGHWLYLRKTK